MCNNVPHKHRDLIVAWANGAKIQYKCSQGTWYDSDRPAWNYDGEYRIKPTPVVVRYRRYLTRSMDVPMIFTLNDYGMFTPREVEKFPNFIKWIDDDWQECVAGE